jgi:hypothetical protein
VRPEFLRGILLALGLAVVGRSGFLARIVRTGVTALPGSGGDLARRCGCLVAIVCGLFFAAGAGLTIQRRAYFVGDAPEYIYIARSLIRDGDLDLRGQIAGPYSTPWNRNGSLSDFHALVAEGARGEWYPKNPWFCAAALAPLYALLGPAGMLLGTTIMGLALALAAYWLGVRFAEPCAAAAAALALCFLTTMGSAALVIGVDVPGALGIAASAVLLARPRPAGAAGEDAPFPPGEARASAGRGWPIWMLAGFAGGLAALATSRNSLYLPFLAAWAFASGRRRGLLYFCLGALPPLAALLWANWTMFGSPLISSYDRVMVLDNGIPRLASHRHQLTLANAGPGLAKAVGELIPDAPAALVAMAGWPALMRRDRTAALCLAGGIGAAFLFAICFRYAEPRRFLLPAFALSAAPLACLFSSSSPTSGSWSQES